MLAMALLGCFITLFRKKKTNKEEKLDASLTGREPGTLQVMLERLKKSTIKDLSNQSSFNVSVPFGTEGSSTCKVKMVVDENPVNNSNPGGGHGGAEAADPAYEGGDEHDENGSMHRDFSDFDLQSQMNQNKTEQHEKLHSKNSRERNSYGGETPVFAIDSDLSYKSDREELGSFDLIQTGHVSDPGIHRKIIWASPKLKRSCSNLETRKMGKNRVPVQLPTSRSQSFEDLQNLSSGEAAIQGVHGRSSPLSVITSCSADQVMLKRRSSSQVLPSRSRRLWWKLFLWSHRNLHRPSLGGKKHRPLPAINEAPSKENGYCSDTLEMGQANKAEPMDSGKSLSPESFSSNLCFNSESKKQDFHDEMFGLRPCKHWVAFSSEESSSVMRVDEWVNSLDPASVSPVEEETAGQSHESEPEMFLLPPSSSSQMMAGLIEKAHHSSRHSNPNHAQDVLQANNVIQSLNSFSTVAHISGMGLKVIPNISPFSGLRSVNLSGNLIVHIAPGSLPKSLHTLNISRNKIVAIEGLRELTRLRVLDLSYNRISRIGHGLSNCTLIKELYLAGNKISDVEGLHRLLKLTVLDLSFNKITTANALGQLVANYNSLLSLNLLGNPIQRNLGDNQLRKAVSGLLPQLSYLNKQSIKPQWAREAVMDSVAKAALGGNNSGWHAHRKALVRAGGSSTVTAALASTSWSSQRGVDGRQRNQKHRSRSRHSASR